jgi:hypothetical protein
MFWAFWEIKARTVMVAKYQNERHFSLLGPFWIVSTSNFAKLLERFLLVLLKKNWCEYLR